VQRRLGSASVGEDHESGATISQFNQGIEDRRDCLRWGRAGGNQSAVEIYYNE
jgi:hypothetical protein